MLPSREQGRSRLLESTADILLYVAFLPRSGRPSTITGTHRYQLRQHRAVPLLREPQHLRYINSNRLQE